MVKRYLAPLLLLAPVVAAASVLDRIYDFTDAYYRANGVDPTKIGGRPQAPTASAVIDTPLKSSQRDVRIVRHFAGYGSNGSTQFFTVHGGGGFDLFTNDKAGREARKIADAFPEYVFPKQGANPVGIANGRQSFIHKNNGGYFSKNPLGLWIHVWVNYTDKAFNTKDGKKELASLQKKNGLALDGTPLIKTESEIDKLYKKGFVTKLTTTDATRYAICPEIRDPRDGGVAPDAFLVGILKRPDGSLLEPQFVEAWESLKTTGNWPK